MSLKLYGFQYSICTKRVLLAAAELGAKLDVESIDIFKGIQKASPGYLKKQPFGQIPCLDDNGFLVYESRAIARYLAAVKFPEKGASLMPLTSEDPKKYAEFEQAASVEMSNFEPYLSVIVDQKVFRPARGQEINVEKLAAAKQSLAQKLIGLETILSKQPWVAGNQLTLVDLFYIPWIQSFGICGEMEIINANPSVKAWWERLSARDSYKKVYAA